MTEKLPTIGVWGDLTDANNQLDSPGSIAGRAIADAGCNILTVKDGGDINGAATAFTQSPYRAGKSIAIQEAPAARRKVAKRAARGPSDGVEINLMISQADSDGRSLDSTFLATADVIVVVAGGGETQARLESVIGRGKPIIALLAKGQKIGAYGTKSLPSAVKIAKNSAKLRSELSSVIAPFTLVKPTFARLRAVYKTDASEVHDCSMSFPNTCAIRMSEALAQVVSGIKDKFASSGSNVCPHKFMRGAQDLAGLLRKGDVFGAYDQGFEAPGSAPASIQGKKGIVCYMNIPSYPDGQGHIDLWEDDHPVGSSYWTGNPIWFWQLN
ncbi:hypothetical protein GR268_36635 [Rhizobium leguminosarum]|nr:hypothetical protein [Rhizobium leguminosarum]